jgi:predicted metal-dependent hydrolase
MLFTVSATFSDFTNAFEQYEVDSHEIALEFFLTSAVALREFDPALLEKAVATKACRLTQVAGDLRGLWVWHSTLQIEHDEVALLGGSILQTDPRGPKREQA